MDEQSSTALRRLSIFLIVCVSFTLIFPGMSWGQQLSESPVPKADRLRTGLELGPFRVHPFFSYSGEVDDNVFRTQFNKRTDYINHINPGVTFSLPLRDDHSFEASYAADILRYSKRTSQDTERHAASGDLSLNFPKLKFSLRDTFNRTDTFPSTELTRRIRRNDNSLASGVSYNLTSKIGAGFNFSWTNSNYLENDFQFLDENSYHYAVNVGYGFLPRASTFLEYGFTQELFRNRPEDKPRDNDKHEALVGVKGELTSILTATAKAGYQRTVFRAKTFTPPGSTDVQRTGDLDSFVTSIEGNYRPLERLAITFVGSRSVQPSTFTSNPAFENFIFSLNMAYTMTPKITLTPRGFFGVDNYRQDVNVAGVGEPARLRKRLDYNYGGGLSVAYQVQKFLSLKATYDFSRRDSNINIADYDDNRVWFSIILGM